MAPIPYGLVRSCIKIKLKGNQLFNNKLWWYNKVYDGKKMKAILIDRLEVKVKPNSSERKVRIANFFKAITLWEHCYMADFMIEIILADTKLQALMNAKLHPTSIRSLMYILAKKFVHDLAMKDCYMLIKQDPQYERYLAILSSLFDLLSPSQVRYLHHKILLKSDIYISLLNRDLLPRYLDYRKPKEYSDCQVLLNFDTKELNKEKELIENIMSPIILRDKFKVFSKAQISSLRDLNYYSLINSWNERALKFTIFLIEKELKLRQALTPKFKEIYWDLKSFATDIDPPLRITASIKFAKNRNLVYLDTTKWKNYRFSASDLKYIILQFSNRKSLTDFEKELISSPAIASGYSVKKDDEKGIVNVPNERPHNFEGFNFIFEDQAHYNHKNSPCHFEEKAEMKYYLFNGQSYYVYQASGELITKYIHRPLADGAVEESLSPLDLIGIGKGGVSLVKGLVSSFKSTPKTVKLITSASKNTISSARRAIRSRSLSNPLTGTSVRASATTATQKAPSFKSYEEFTQFFGRKLDMPRETWRDLQDRIELRTAVIKSTGEVVYSAIPRRTASGEVTVLLRYLRRTPPNGKELKVIKTLPPHNKGRTPEFIAEYSDDSVEAIEVVNLTAALAVRRTARLKPKNAFELHEASLKSIPTKDSLLGALRTKGATKFADGSQRTIPRGGRLVPKKLQVVKLDDGRTADLAIAVVIRRNQKLADDVIEEAVRKVAKEMDDVIKRIEINLPGGRVLNFVRSGNSFQLQ